MEAIRQLIVVFDFSHEVTQRWHEGNQIVNFLRVSSRLFVGCLNAIYLAAVFWRLSFRRCVASKTKALCLSFVSSSCAFVGEFLLPLNTNHLPQRVCNLNQITLRVHHVLDVFVSHRSFVNHVFVLPAFDAFGGFGVIGGGEAALGFVA